MTKKDYILLAQAIKQAKPEGIEEERAVWLQVVGALSYVLGIDNPRFQALKFKEACGVAE